MTGEEIVIRKHKHGIGFVIGMASIAAGAILALIVLLGFLGVNTDTGFAGPSGGGLFAEAGIAPSDKDGGIVRDGRVTVTTIDDGCQDHRADIRDLKLIKEFECEQYIRFKLIYWTEEESHLSNTVLIKAISIEDLKERPDKYPTVKFGIQDKKDYDKGIYNYYAYFSAKEGIPAYIWIMHSCGGYRTGDWETSYIYRIDV